ncbi:hypothetical protein PR048_016308 [Dryococelus australis]|uniref:Transposase n=1 Tax=Dryococelus australis TaxID=614101 RepID=A0ABQ9HJY6_9NEOP|nr:hypothetical protein PR048_016308 [Dryococelus australis]
MMSPGCGVGSTRHKRLLIDTVRDTHSKQPAQSTARRRPRSTATSLRQDIRRATGVNVSGQTVRNRLHDAGLLSHRPLPKAPQPHHRADRWKHTLFADEVTVSLHPYNRCIRVWRRLGERWNESIQEHRQQQGGSVMFWGGVMFGRRMQLIPIQGNMTGLVYQENILQPVVTGFSATVGEGFTLVDDNARLHRTRVVNQFLATHGILRMEWPAYSTDINCMEHAWSELNRAIANRLTPPANIQQLTDAAIQEWDALPQDKVDCLVLSMPRRVQACFWAQGLIGSSNEQSGFEAPRGMNHMVLMAARRTKDPSHRSAAMFVYITDPPTTMLNVGDLDPTNTMLDTCNPDYSIHVKMTEHSHSLVRRPAGDLLVRYARFLCQLTVDNIDDQSALLPNELSAFRNTHSLPRHQHTTTSHHSTHHSTTTLTIHQCYQPIARFSAPSPVTHHSSTPSSIPLAITSPHESSPPHCLTTNLYPYQPISYTSHPNYIHATAPLPRLQYINKNIRTFHPPIPTDDEDESRKPVDEYESRCKPLCRDPCCDVNRVGRRLLMTVPEGCDGRRHLLMPKKLTCSWCMANVGRMLFVLVMCTLDYIPIYVNHLNNYILKPTTGNWKCNTSKTEEGGINILAAVAVNPQVSSRAIARRSGINQASVQCVPSVPCLSIKNYMETILRIVLTFVHGLRHDTPDFSCIMFSDEATFINHGHVNLRNMNYCQ